MSWFVDFEGDRAVITIPEMFLENARQSIEDTTGHPVSGLFLSVGIAIEEVFDPLDFYLLIQGGDN